MILFYAPNTCALAVHIALEQVGAQYELRRLNFAAGEQRTPEYLAINPKGRVPALSTSRGVLTEATAILVYIAQRYPEAKLAPLDDAYAFAEMQSFNSYLSSTVQVAHAHRVRGSRWSDEPKVIEALKKKVAENMTASFELIERWLQGPWVFGEAFTISDIYLFTFAGWLASDGVDIQKFPKVNAHYERMAVLPAVIRALAQEQG